MPRKARTDRNRRQLRHRNKVTAHFATPTDDERFAAQRDIMEALKLNAQSDQHNAITKTYREYGGYPEQARKIADELVYGDSSAYKTHADPALAKKLSGLVQRVIKKNEKPIGPKRKIR
jgi:hypothetical protein